VKLTISMVKNLICIRTKSGKTCSDNDAIKFVAMCQARRLNPFEGDAFLIGYDSRDAGPTFSLITAHQAFLKRAELNQEYDGMKSGIIVKNEEGEMKDLEGDFYIEGQELLGGWATVYFKNRKQPMHKRIRLKRFQKSWGIWQDDPAGMICKCAEADALRSSFPTMLGGLYLREELKVDTDPKVSAPIFSTPVVDVPPETPPVPEPVKPKPELKVIKKAPETENPAFKVQKAVRGLMEKAEVTEEHLIHFLHDIGFLPDNVTKMEQFGPEIWDMIYSQSNDLFSKMKETQQ
jgi:phage recombination protein Bet